MEIKASDVQKLRQTTGAGLMDCKKALTDANGDMDKAMQLLRERGIAKSAKRSDKAAGEGVVAHWISADSHEGLLFELNCETDFVARTPEFVALADALLKKIHDGKLTSVEQLPVDEIATFSAKSGEKIQPRRFAQFKSENGIVAAYIHAGAKLGVLVQIDSNKAGAVSDDLKELAREVALQIAGAAPTYVNQSEVPADIVAREKEIAKKQLEGQNKPAEILEKIATGKLQQFFASTVLVDQPHVRDSSGKTKISDLVQGVGRKIGADLKIARFARFRVGAE
jgi:elongation factor Ts